MFGFYGYLARLRVYTLNYATRLQGKYLWNEYFTLHKLNLSFHSPALNAPFSKFENRKSASFWLKKAKFEALSAPKYWRVYQAISRIIKYEMSACTGKKIVNLEAKLVSRLDNEN